MIEEQKYKIEIELLLNSLKRTYGWDFSNYKKSSLLRRFHVYMQQNNLDSISDIIPYIMYNEQSLNDLIHIISVPVTSFFRDPGFYIAFKELVLPVLSTYPYFTLWNPGCANGMETYSITILLAEANLLRKAQMLGTDINNDSLDISKKAIYSEKEILNSEKAYEIAKGNKYLKHYFYEHNHKFEVEQPLRDIVDFSFHNLVCDKKLFATNVIICRNVFIYFNRDLQNHVMSLFLESLCPGGFLCLGTKETLEFTNYNHEFNLLSNEYKIYRKKYPSS